ncbi:MAG TPA: NTP transferase domain-containing protein, partial [Xanthomonadales bacterium]|nr:NTP transferase domain-containing protein [Xanthomonadales bacterium]
LLVVLGAFHDRIEAALDGIAFERVANPDWPRGLGTSLRACARALAAHRGPTLVVACDQPALEAAHLHALLALAAQAPSGCAATAHGESRGIPAVVSASVLAQALDFDGDRGFGAALAALDAAALGVLDAPALRLDVDDAAGLRAAVAAGLLDRDDGGTPPHA